jgi:hypothetical protein
MSEKVHRSALHLTPTVQKYPSNRCQQEKRYRSMQEHIRRAHPDFYIPKLPATEESFQLMISTPPTKRPPQQQPAAAPQRRGPCTLWSRICSKLFLLNSIQPMQAIMILYSEILMSWARKYQ